VTRDHATVTFINGDLTWTPRCASLLCGEDAREMFRIDSKQKRNVSLTVSVEPIVSSPRLTLSRRCSKLFLVDTMPAYATTTSIPNHTLSTSKDVTHVEQKVVVHKEPTVVVSEESLGDELVFKESGNQKPEKEFMFAQNNTFIQIDGDIIKTFQLRLCREISFQFRTRLPHGLLVYHNVKNPEGIELDPYALYVIVEKGQLKVVHVFGKHSTSVSFQLSVTLCVET
jgi:hypothetical protein